MSTEKNWKTWAKGSFAYPESGTWAVIRYSGHIVSFRCKGKNKAEDVAKIFLKYAICVTCWVRWVGDAGRVVEKNWLLARNGLEQEWGWEDAQGEGSLWNGTPGWLGGGSSGWRESFWGLRGKNLLPLPWDLREELILHLWVESLDLMERTDSKELVATGK